MGSLGVGHNWAASLSLFTFMHWRRKWQPTPVFLPGESQGRWRLVGCRLWGLTESDMTERLSSSSSVYMSVLVSQFICPPTPKNTLLCIRMNHGFCGSGIWMQWEGLVSVWCQSGEPEPGETSASGAGTWAGMGRRLGSAGTLGQSASQVAPPAWRPPRVAGPFIAAQCSCVPRGICMAFMTQLQKSHGITSVVLYWSTPSQARLTQRRQHCPGPQWEGIKCRGHVKAATDPLNFFVLWSFDVL